VRPAACRVLRDAEGERTREGHGHQRKRPAGAPPPPALQVIPAEGDLARASQARQRLFLPFVRDRLVEMSVELLEQPAA
jgi:hypothetical protein